MVLSIKAVNVTLNRKHILHDVSFNVGQGEVVGLVGKNGAGKTTIMKSVLGLIPTTGGEIKLNDELVGFKHHAPLEHVRSLIENPAVYGTMTGRQHLELYRMGEDVSDEELQTIMKRTGIDKFADRKVKQYSLGMRQRLGIAMTLLGKPELVILDEPMNGLDPQSMHEMRELIADLSQNDGISFLISSHLLDELSRVADRLVIINEGQVIENGTQAEIAQRISGDRWLTLKTSNNLAAAKALASAGVDVSDGGKNMLINLSEHTIDEVIRIVAAVTKLKFETITETQQSLEDTFLDMINESKQEEVTNS